MSHTLDGEERDRLQFLTLERRDRDAAFAGAPESSHRNFLPARADVVDDVLRRIVRDATTDPVRMAQWRLGLAAQPAELRTQMVRSLSRP
jgi:hypothetical protein